MREYPRIYRNDSEARPLMKVDKRVRLCREDLQKLQPNYIGTPIEILIEFLANGDLHVIEWLEEDRTVRRYFLQSSPTYNEWVKLYLS